MALLRRLWTTVSQPCKDLQRIVFLGLYENIYTIIIYRLSNVVDVEVGNLGKLILKVTYNTTAFIIYRLCR